MKWQPIETAPKDGTFHTRGLWVTSFRGTPHERTDWQQFNGIIDDDGDFVDPDWDECFGWNAEDYTHWMPLPPPPEPTL
jgi:hypothetical protein